MLRLVGAHRALRPDDFNFATAPAFQDCAITVQLLPLQNIFSCRRPTHEILLVVSLLLSSPVVVLRLVPRLVPVSVAFIVDLSPSGGVLLPAGVHNITRLAIETAVSFLLVT